MGVLDWLFGRLRLDGGWAPDEAAELEAAQEDLARAAAAENAALEAEIDRLRSRLGAAGFAGEKIDQFVWAGGATNNADLIESFLAENGRDGKLTADVSFGQRDFGQEFLARAPYEKILQRMGISLNGEGAGDLRARLGGLDAAVAVRFTGEIPWDALRRSQWSIAQFIVGFGALAEHIKYPNISVAFFAEEPRELPEEFLRGGLYCPQRSD